MELALVLIAIAFYISWNIGANGSGSAMGTAVGSEILSFRQAVFIMGIFAILGSCLGGGKVMETVGKKVIPTMTPDMAVLIFLSAGVLVTIGTIKGLPTSVTQVLIGGMIGTGLALGVKINWSILTRIVLAWIMSPILSGIFAFLLYKFYSKVFRRIKGIRRLEILYKWMAISGGSYIAFNFGSNEVANAVAPLVGAGVLSSFHAGIFGALSLAIGSLTFSYPVMYTVGKKITALGPISAFSAQFGSAISVSLANYFGLPVSSSQAIVGGVMGAGLAAGEGFKTKTLKEIVISWAATPLGGAILGYSLGKLFLAFGLLSLSS
ncbi:sodium-dependent phosphate transporter [Pyrococcus sp. NA2]|uniref:inorganic phosphate transporter n=1 Tax=Pyrococcus sp. (strain NA2) TaxID=342949 RepID=UPI000209AB87|nr:inorganic phosphate transporter [Pyrococcus sp. NA2]AEC52674.1 sodium-dependent phosphate transporter [Pyrococcus sp. NA2]